MVVRTALDTPDPNEDPVSYNVRAVRSQAYGPDPSPWGPRETHGAVSETSGGAYHLRHFRSAPAQEYGAISGQGRLLGPAMIRPDAPVTFNGPEQRVTTTPTNYLQAVGRDDRAAMARRVTPPPHPVHFPRSNGQNLTGNQYYADGDRGGTNAEGRSLPPAVYRPEWRY